MKRLIALLAVAVIAAPALKTTVNPNMPFDEKRQALLEKINLAVDNPGACEFSREETEMAGNANKGFAASEIQKSIEDHLGIPALLDLPNKKCCDSKKEYKKLSDKHISILEKSRAIRPTTPWLADILIMISDDICVKRQSFEPPTITTAAQPKKGKRKWRTLMRKRTNRPTTQKISRKKRFIKGLKGFGNGVAYVAAGILDMMCHPCFWH